MKKILTVIVLLVYFTVSSGFVVSFHYCMDELASTEIGTSSSDACGKCGMQVQDSHCCWDDVKMVKLQSDHFASDIAAVQIAPALPAVVITPFLTTPFYNFSLSGFWANDEGPPLPGQDRYLLNRVFRI